jgi:hypothetical protein
MPNLVRSANRACHVHPARAVVAPWCARCPLVLEMNIDRLQQQELLPIQLYSVLVGNNNDQAVVVVFL